MAIIKRYTKEALQLAEKYGYLPYMIQRYIDLLGNHDTIKLLEANQNPPTTWIRVNSLKINIDEIVRKLQKKGFQMQRSEWIPYAFEVQKEPSNIGALHEYLLGYYYIQQIASMLPPEILNPKPLDRVIDMCAAPGGKSTHLAQLMQNKGELILIERNQKRISALKINIRRMGIVNSIILNEDAVKLPNLNLKADKILLDAPCTGEGLIRIDPSRKKSKSLDDIKKMGKIQKKLLSAGLESLKYGGLLIYSTCSIAPEENEFVINEVLNDKPNIKIIKIKHQYGISGFTKVYGTQLNEDLKFAQRIFPHLHNTIGFFICLLQKGK
ncbi:MAG: RsmB/NOP family class I SAM-dependent RNA methyltransferase [Promethearchaeota archaeon]|nr:MAG: RsmB/NOP family class I SAM-dependent RNA methyltransferase [Candidatus Lokiarchaeota archaeon]